MIPYKGNENVVEWLIDSLDAAIRKNLVFETKPQAPQDAFAPEVSKTASVHVRAAYSDNRRWASAYPNLQIPPNIGAFVNDCFVLGKEALRKCKLTPVPGTETRGMFDPTHIADEWRPAAIVAKVKATCSGEIFLNRVPATLRDVRKVCASLQQLGGQFWYHREDPGSDGPEEAETVIQAAIDHRLTIRLCEQDFD